MTKKIEIKAQYKIINEVSKGSSKKLWDRSGAKLSPEEKSRLKNIIERHIKDLHTHFREDEWEINLELVKSDILIQFLGVDLYFYLICRFVENKNYEVVYGKKYYDEELINTGTYIRKKNKDVKDKQSKISRRKGEIDNDSRRRKSKKTS